MKKGFTLAEILISLLIIGGIAALTIPPLMTKYNERRTIVKLKKAHAELTQVMREIVAENGDLDGWADDSEDFLVNELAKHLKGAKIKSTSRSIGGCIGWNHKSIDALNGYNYSVQSRYKNSHPNFTCKSYKPNSLSPSSGASYFNFCAMIMVELGSYPRYADNQCGKNIFGFLVWYDGTVTPMGMSWDHPLHGFSSCLSNNGIHAGCTAWMIYNENMDYKRCPDKVGWSKAKSCKEANNKE